MTESGPGKWARWRALLLAAAGSLAIVLVAYANSFHNSFHFDDSHVIQSNLFVRSLANAGRFFTDARTFSSLPANQTYRPLLTLSYALDYRLGGGLDPLAFHITQLALHLLVAAGLFLLFLRVMDEAEPGPANRYLALFAATWFAVHTANTETVNYLSCRSDIVAMLGIVASFATYLYLPRSRRFHLYLIPMLLGALGKLPSVMFAPMLLAYVLLFEDRLSFPDVLRRESRASVRRALLRTLPAFVLGLLAFLFIQGMNPPSQTYGGGSRWAYLMTQPWVWLHYAKLFVLPVGLTADTDWTLLTTWTGTRFFAGACFVALLVWAIVRSSRTRTWRPVSFGLVWFALGLLPSSSVFPLAEVTNEHRIYIPVAGLVLAASWTALRVARSRRGERVRVPWGWVAAGAVLLVANVWGTVVRNRVWRSESTLWADVVRKSPGNGRAWMNYGLTQMEAGDYRDARANFEHAARLWPYYAPVQVNLGIVTHQLGDTAAADRHFHRALALEPAYAAGHYFYGRYLLETGRGPEAIPELRQALTLSPNYAPPRSMLLKLYYVLGSDSEVTKLANQTLAIDPNDAEARSYLAGNPPLQGRGKTPYDRGLSLTAAHRQLEAGVAYQSVLHGAPRNPDALLNLGWALAQLGFDSLAAVRFQQVLELRPKDTLAANDLAWVRTRMAVKGR